MQGLAGGARTGGDEFLVVLPETVEDDALAVAGRIQAWLAAHPRFQVTCTPKHASWLNMIGQWSGTLTRRLLRRGDFASRDELEAKIIAFTIRHNKKARPYRWSYDADADHARYLERHAQPPTVIPEAA